MAEPRFCTVWRIISCTLAVLRNSLCWDFDSILGVQEMFGNRFLGETSFEDSLSEDENEDLAQALELSSQKSNGKGIYLPEMESLHIDEDDLLVHTLEESIQLSRKSRGKSLQTKRVVICDICEEEIINSLWFKTYWGQTYCEKHQFDGTPICCSCYRFEIGNIKCVNLSDGRKLCTDCYSTSVMDSESCKSLVLEVINFYTGLNMQISKDIPVLLVDQVEMKRLSPLPHGVTLGLTTSKVDTITCVKSSSQRGQNIQVVKQVRHLSRHYLVTSMMLLYGYPKLAIGATLAHEMMHTWMRFEGYHDLDEKIEEGICEVMAYKWLDLCGFIGEEMDDSFEEFQFLRNFKEYLKSRIESNYSRTYGDGFRDAKWAVEKYGFRYTMKTIANTGKFPD